MALENKRRNEQSNSDEAFDIKKLVARLVGHWHLFVIGFIICLTGAYLYLRYATLAYKINAQISVSDGSSGNAGDRLLKSSSADFSGLFDLSSNAYNEIDILKSRLLMANTVRALELNVTIFANYKVSSFELYDEAPFYIKLISKADSITERNFDVTVVNDKIQLKNNKEDVNIVADFGRPIKLKQYDLVFYRKPGNVDPYGYKVNIQSEDERVDALSKSFNVDLTDKKSTTLALSFEYPNPKKGEVILQKLMDLYLLSNLRNKTQIADSTLKFINGQLAKVTTELSGIEGNFTKFKEENQLANVDEQGKMLVENASASTNKLNDLRIQVSVVNDIQKYINDPRNTRIIPSSFAVPDPVFAAAIAKYNELLVERDKLGLSYKDSNPVVQAIDEQIANGRAGLLRSFESYRQSLETTLNESRKVNSGIQNQVSTAPKKERVFLDYTREQNLKQELYLYLLQKREETAISKTSTMNNSRIVDPAKSDYRPFKPKHPLVLLLGVFLGLLIPAAYIYAKDLLNIRILTKGDVEANTDTTVIGEIGNNPGEQSLVVQNNDRSNLSEQFRGLRTNLQFVLPTGKSTVILVTSSMSGEGKSFITTNLGSVFCLSGKKVVLIELDLRKPTLSAKMGLDNSHGFTNYMISENMKIDEIIKPSTFSENCFVISSGPIPPNPAELLLSEKVNDMMNLLKERFDYIIIDSAPIGLVSDAQLIEKYADASLYIIRQGFTFKSQLNIINDLKSEGKLRRPFLVINDIKTRKGGYYGYGYGYSYSYGYGYGSEAEQSAPGLLSKLFKKRK